MWRFSQCTERYSPIRQMGNARKLFLEGVCSHSRVDRDFVMKSQTEFLGYILTSMVYSVNNSRWEYSMYSMYSVYSVYNDRWEIVNSTNTSQVFAFMQDSDFPLGVNKWKFTEAANCSDPGEDFRSLSLHLNVTMPGRLTTPCRDSQGQRESIM